MDITNYVRRHETPNVVYDMIVAIPLPAGANGEDAFTPDQQTIPVLSAAGTPLVYGGKEVVLHRSYALEKSLLAGVETPTIAPASRTLAQ